MNATVTALRQTIALLGRGWRLRWMLLVAMALTVTALEAVGVAAIFALLNLAAAPAAAVDLPVVGGLIDHLPADERLRLVLVAGAVGTFFVLRAAFVLAQTYVQNRLTDNAGERLSSHLVRGYLSLPYLVHTQQNSAELVRNAFDSVQTMIKQVLRPLVTLLSKGLLCIGIIVVVTWVTPLATLMAVTALAPALWLMLRVLQPRLKQLGRTSQDSKRDSLKAVQQALGGVRDIKFLGRERYFAEAFAQERRKLARAHYLKATIRAAPHALIETTIVLIIIALFVVSLFAAERIDTTLATLGLFAYAGFRLEPNLRVIVESLNDIRFGSAVLDDLAADRRRVDAALAADDERRTAGPKRSPLAHGIEFRDVSFSYHPDAAPAVRHLDLTISSGEAIGVCGPTGGGKSTFVDLLAGLLTPTSGEVLVDGRRLEPEPHWWRDQLGVVSQSVFLIDDTLRRNIAFGWADHRIDEERLQDAIRRAQLGSVVARLPDGLDTMVGERGIRLSGGQRQRVAVARALYRQPRVIIFDEGTSALDGTTEAALIAAVDALRGGRTLVMVAHRITTVRGADRIIVIDHGHLVAQGTYQQLLDSSALFQDLARGQAVGSDVARAKERV